MNTNGHEWKTSNQYLNTVIILILNFALLKIDVMADCSAYRIHSNRPGQTSYVSKNKQIILLLTNSYSNCQFCSTLIIKTLLCLLFVPNLYV